MQSVHTAASVFLFQDYSFYLASAICEWIMAFNFIFFFYTYIDDFKVSMKPSNANLFLFLLFNPGNGSYFSVFLFPAAVYITSDNREWTVVWSIPSCQQNLVWMPVFYSLKMCCLYEMPIYFCSLHLHFTLQGFCKI